MIPVEKIAGGTIGNLLYYIAIVGLLLVVATIIRLKVPALRKAFIPASLIAGLIGLALGQYGLKVIPADMMSSIGSLPSHMITIVFACMLLGVKKEETDATMVRDAGAGLLWLWSCSFMQVGIPALLTALILVPMFGVNPLFASLVEIGYAGGHGTAGGMQAAFEELGWMDGATLGSTMATVGLLCGIFGGMIIINYAVRKKYTLVLTEPAQAGTSKEVFAESEREPAAHTTISNDVVDSFAFHFGIIGIAILIGRVLVVYLNMGMKAMGISNSLPLFPFAMIGGWLINMVVQRTSLKDLFDRKTFQRIQGMALEILVVGAVASIKVPVVIAYLAPILIVSVVVMILMLFWVFWLSPRVFKECWFEQAIIRYGAFTGVAAVGYMLLRTADPKMETKAGSIYALDCPFMSPFIGGGLVTSMWPTLITGMGVLTFGLAATAISIALLAVLLVVFRVKDFKMQQR